MIIDTFRFNKDFNALKIRLAELYDVVDLFVIAERSYTDTGKRKPLYLSQNMSMFAKYSDKIKIVSSSKRYFTTNPRIRESRQRQLITTYLQKMRLTKSDLIIHSDCDEIPRSSIIEKLAKTKTSCNFLLELDMYSTRLNLYDSLWARCRVVSGDNYRSIAKLRQDIFLYNNYDIRRHNLPLIRVPDFWTHKYYGLWIFPQFVFTKPDLQVVKNAGWHFNNLFSLNQIIEKVEASSHYEFNTKEVKSNLVKYYGLGQEIYSGKQLKVVPIDETYPEIVRKNLAEWSEFIYPQIQHHQANT